MELKLSQKTFKALANPTRIAILKELDKRNFTQSELSDNLGFAITTIKQHINDLEKADLVKIIDDGRKWKYISLTKEGKAILHPEEKKIWILLGTLGVSVVGGIIASMKKAVTVPLMMKSQIDAAPQVNMLAEEAVQKTVAASAETFGGARVASEAAVKYVSTGSVQDSAVQAVQESVVQAPVPEMIHKTADFSSQTIASTSQTPVLVYVFIILALLCALGIGFYLWKRHKRLRWLRSIGGN